MGDGKSERPSSAHIEPVASASEICKGLQIWTRCGQNPTQGSRSCGSLSSREERNPALPSWPGLQSRGQPSTAARPQRPDILAALGLASRIRAAGEAVPG